MYISGHNSYENKIVKLFYVAKILTIILCVIKFAVKILIIELGSKMLKVIYGSTCIHESLCISDINKVLFHNGMAINGGTFIAAFLNKYNTCMHESLCISDLWQYPINVAKV